VLGADDETSWRLLLLEDCDELIRAEAKQSTGQALSRLLNLTDGLLGQGRRVLVAVTTKVESAAMRLARTNSAIPASSTGRRPKRSDRGP
jgi:hypothetical protein